ncbi:unnamed protein product [Caenorhabditis brenneri]
MADQEEQVTNLSPPSVAFFLNVCSVVQRFRAHIRDHQDNNIDNIELLRNIEYVATTIVYLGVRPYSRQDIDDLLGLAELLTTLVENGNDERFY